MLQTWEAVRYEKIMDNGRTKPLIIECEYLPSAGAEEVVEPEVNTTNRRLMVVKTPGNPSVTTTSLLCEVIGNLLAREFDIATPQPALVNLSQEFVDAVQPYVQKCGINLQPGLGSGCEFISGGARPVIHGASQSPEEFSRATLIFGFDLLTQNPDRRPEKPNCASTRGRSYLAFDFEMCFSFLFSIRKVDAWRVSQTGIGCRHLFYSALKNKAPDWQPLIERLKILRSETLDGWASLLPHDWLAHYPEIREHLLAVAAHADEFEIELQRSLI